MRIFEKVSDLIQKICSLLSTVILVVMTVVYFASIVQRYLVGQGFHGSEEITRYGMIWLVYISAVVITRLDEHLNVSILENMFKGMPRKIIKLIQRLLMIAYLVLMTGIGFQMVQVGARQTSPNLGIPMSVIYTIFPAAFILMIIQFVFITVRDFMNREDQGTASDA